MALVYFDSSALVKLVVDEDGSDLAAELWDGCDAALASRLAYPEVRAALAASCRKHDLSEQDLDAAEQAWEEFWAAVRPVELTLAVERYAGQLARSHALRGADAVHLASALALSDPDLILAVWDRRLHAGAATAGLPVAQHIYLPPDPTSPGTDSGGLQISEDPSMADAHRGGSSPLCGAHQNVTIVGGHGNRE